MGITHAKVSALPDGPDAAQVQPSDWNDDHVGASELLGIKTYASGGALTATSGTLIDADATNLAVTFTAPSSGEVLVRLTGTMRVNAAVANRVLWGL